MTLYNEALLYAIEREKTGVDFVCEGNDSVILRNMLNEINLKTGNQLKYLAELDSIHVFGAGEIVSRYVDLFSSESVRAYLISQMVADKVKDCDSIILRLYLHFQSSNQYISLRNSPSSAHIYVRYDNAFRKLRSRRLKKDLLHLMCYPRNVFYLPLTFNMLASWKMPELKELLLKYSTSDFLSPIDVGLSVLGESDKPQFSFMHRQIRLTSIGALKYYPAKDVADVLISYLSDSDEEIRSLTQKSLKIIKRKMDS